MKSDDCDPNVIPEREILSVDADGIRYAGGFIDFAVCAERYGEINGRRTTCVAERDITTLQFVFYTNPLTIVTFVPKHRWGKRAATDRFRALQKQILAYGYKTYDLS